MRFQFYRGVHFGEFKIAAVVARQAHPVEQPVICTLQFLSAVGVFEDPFRERFFDPVLLFPRRDRFRLIDDALFLAVLFDRVINRGCTKIHGINKQPVCGRSLGAEHLRLLHSRVRSHRVILV